MGPGKLSQSKSKKRLEIPLHDVTTTPRRKLTFEEKANKSSEPKIKRVDLDKFKKSSPQKPHLEKTPDITRKDSMPRGSEPGETRLVRRSSKGPEVHTPKVTVKKGPSVDNKNDPHQEEEDRHWRMEKWRLKHGDIATSNDEGDDEPCELDNQHEANEQEETEDYEEEGGEEEVAEVDEVQEPEGQHEDVDQDDEETQDYVEVKADKKKRTHNATTTTCPQTASRHQDAKEKKGVEVSGDNGQTKTRQRKKDQQVEAVEAGPTKKPRKTGTEEAENGKAAVKKSRGEKDDAKATKNKDKSKAGQKDDKQETPKTEKGPKGKAPKPDEKSLEAEENTEPQRKAKSKAEGKAKAKTKAKEKEQVKANGKKPPAKATKGKKASSPKKAHAKAKGDQDLEENEATDSEEEVGKYSAPSSGPVEAKDPKEPKRPVVKRSAPPAAQETQRTRKSKTADTAKDAKENKDDKAEGQVKEGQRDTPDVAAILRSATSELVDPNKKAEDEKNEEEDKQDRMRRYKARKGRFYRSLASRGPNVHSCCCT